jgi:sulfur-oxidizing protein SoxX
MLISGIKTGILAASIAVVAALTVTVPAVQAADDVMALGTKVAFDRKLGNCLACHHIPGGVSPGMIGPPLIGMKARYPDKAKLRAQIWDSTVANPNSMMPPFGLHNALTDEQIDAVSEFIYSL